MEIQEVWSDERSCLANARRRLPFISILPNIIWASYPGWTACQELFGSFSSLQACGRWYPSIIPVKVSVFCQTAPSPTTRYNYLLYLQQNEVNHTFNHSVSQATYVGLPRASKHSYQLFRQKRKKNVEISLGKIFCIWFHLCWGQSGSDISLNLIWVDRIYTEKKKIKVPQQIIWKEVDTIYLTHLLCHLQDGLRPTSCINQGKVVETKFYLELSGFLYKMSSKINVSWWSLAVLGKKFQWQRKMTPKNKMSPKNALMVGNIHLQVQRKVVLETLFLFIYFWLCWVFIALCGFSLVSSSGGYSLLQCAGFSQQWLPCSHVWSAPVWSTGSRRLGFRSCSTWTQ